MSYHREIPRDLFNEAKLLKCLGQLSLYHLDGHCPKLRIQREDSRTDFIIDQDDSDGSLFVVTISFWLTGEKREDDWKSIYFSTPYNSKDSYPLWFRVPDTEDEGRVFNESGVFTPEFKSLVEFKK